MTSLDTSARAARSLPPDPVPPGPGGAPASEGARGRASRRAVLLGGGGVVAVGGLGGLRLITGGDAAPEAAAPGGPGVPRRFGLSVPGSPLNARASIAAGLAAGALLGRRPDILNVYVAWEWGAPFPARYVERAHAFGVLPQITWEPWDPRLGPEQPRYRLADLEQHRDYVDRFARAAARVGLPVNLRFSHEMNGDWYPWATGVNGNSALDYVAAHRWVHERFVAAGADQVSWTWCLNATSVPGQEDVAAAYPGDDVVDIVAVDGYDYGGTLSPEQVFAAPLAQLDALAPDLPLCVNEVGTTRLTGQADWANDCVEYLRGTRVSALVWFDIATPTGQDFRISTPTLAPAVRDSFASWR